MSQSRGKFFVLCICLTLVFNNVKAQQQMCSAGEMLRVTLVTCVVTGPCTPYPILGRILPQTIGVTMITSSLNTGTCRLAAMGDTIEAVLSASTSECLGVVTSCEPVPTVPDDGSPESGGESR